MFITSWCNFGVFESKQDHKPLPGLEPVPKEALERQANIAADDLAAASSQSNDQAVLQACIVNRHVSSFCTELSSRYFKKCTASVANWADSSHVWLG